MKRCHLQIFRTSFDLSPKNNIYTIIYREEGTFVTILTPGLPAYRPKTRLIWMIYQIVSLPHLSHLSCELFPKNNIYTRFYKEMGMFLLILNPGFPPLFPQNNVNLNDTSKVVTCASYPHVKYPPNIISIPWFIARCTSSWTPSCPHNRQIFFVENFIFYFLLQMLKMTFLVCSCGRSIMCGSITVNFLVYLTGCPTLWRSLENSVIFIFLERSG